MGSLPLGGHCDARFAAVREAFIGNFEERAELGASVSVVVDGRAVVDLWGGYADAGRTRPWRQNTLVNVWSIGKAATALALLKTLESAGRDVDDPIAGVWPEFGAQRKEEVSFATAMAHRAGLCSVEALLPEDAFLHWELMADALARQRPWWEPGTAHGYHSNTIGFLMGEPVRRITGRRLRDWFQDEVAGPLELDFHFGVAAADVQRCADLVPMTRPPEFTPRRPAESTDGMARMRSFLGNPPMAALDLNSAAWRTSEFPSTSPQSNARSVARMFGHLATWAHDGSGGLISSSLLARAIAIASDGIDLNLGRPTRFGLGFQLTQPDRPLGPNDDTFGHYGNGGHLGFADPAVPLGFAYNMNHQGFAWRDPRNLALTDAVYASL